MDASFCETETDADAERAAEHRQQREIETDCLQRESARRRSASIARTNLPSTTRKLTSEMRRLGQPLLDETRDPQRYDQREDDDQYRAVPIDSSDVRVTADGYLDVVERVRDLGQKAEESTGSRDAQMANAIARSDVGTQLCERNSRRSHVHDHADRRERDQKRR